MLSNSNGCTSSVPELLWHWYITCWKPWWKWMASFLMILRTHTKQKGKGTDYFVQMCVMNTYLTCTSWQAELNGGGCGVLKWKRWLNIAPGCHLSKKHPLCRCVAAPWLALKPRGARCIQECSISGGGTRLSCCCRGLCCLEKALLDNAS